MIDYIRFEVEPTTWRKAVFSYGMYLKFFFFKFETIFSFKFRSRNILENFAYREIIAASSSEFGSHELIFGKNGLVVGSPFLVSFLLKILLIEKLVKLAFVFP